ncbi:MAG: hypothetical protein K6E98_12155 [Lachnospiraceae bacterium]|nr:hypothetical protein [Lachnospiraceae bacterium]
MKISPLNEAVSAYKEVKPLDKKDIELNSEKLSGVNEVNITTIKEPGKAEALDNKIREEGREIIGISDDGDTARASKESLENIEEGMVFKKSAVSSLDGADNKEKINVRETEEDGSKEESLLGYSERELQRLYLQGDIDSEQLDKELERREEIQGEKDEARIEENKKEQEENKVNDAVVKEAEDKREYGAEKVIRQNEEVKEAGKEASEKRFVEAVKEEDSEVSSENENGNQGSVTQNEKRIITEDMALDDEFVQRMNVLEGAMRENRINSEALNEAAENGRLKIMEQVMGVDPATASNI